MVIAIVEFVIIVVLAILGPWLNVARFNAMSIAGTPQIVAAGVPRPTIYWTATPPDERSADALRADHIKLFSELQRTLNKAGYSCEFDESRRLLSISGDGAALPGSAGWTLQMVVVSPDSFAGPASDRRMALKGLYLTRVNGERVNFLSAQVAIQAFGLGISDATSTLQPQTQWADWTFDVSGPGTEVAGTPFEQNK